MLWTRGPFFEISPLYGKSRVTGLARINGYPVALMANNPMIRGGSTDVAAGSKVMRLMQLCDTFHLPLISLCDEPGFHVGLDQEKLGIERAGARFDEHGLPFANAVVHDSRRSNVRRGRPVPSSCQRHVQALCLAVRELGIDAHRRRRECRVSTRNRGGG